MSYKSILPDGYVPSRECVDWLQNEAERLFDMYGIALHEYANNILLVNADKEYKHVQNLHLFTEIAHSAFKDAYKRWINQQAFDFLMEGLKEMKNS